MTTLCTEVILRHHTVPEIITNIVIVTIPRFQCMVDQNPDVGLKCMSLSSTLSY